MLAQIQKRDAELQESRLVAERAKSGQEAIFFIHESRVTHAFDRHHRLQRDAHALEVEARRKEWVEDLRRVHDSGRYLLELINAYSRHLRRSKPARWSASGDLRCRRDWCATSTPSSVHSSSASKIGFVTEYAANMRHHAGRPHQGAANACSIC
jgi:hypothetical protein